MAKQHNNNVKKPVTKDPRFANVHHDPRFMRPKKQDMKVTIDKRFASMMNSAEFSDARKLSQYISFYIVINSIY